MLLRIEFREPAIYWDILDAIGNGKTRQNEIGEYAHISPTDLSPYLRNLLWAELIRRDHPISDEARAGDTRHRPILKNGHYALNDNFLKFWFRFIAPHLPLLSQKKLTVDRIRAGYNTYLGEIFELIARQYVARQFSFDYIGAWWGKNDLNKAEKIDILAFNQEDELGLIGECKWSENVDPNQIIKELDRKAQFIRYNKKLIPKEYEYIIFAKSFQSDHKIEIFKDKHVYYIDLQDLEAENNR